MKLLIDIEKDYYEMLRYNVEHGQKYKPFEIIANGIPYDERPQLSEEQIEKITDLLETEFGYEGIREDVSRILRGEE